jgi:hypothetical protein
MRWLDTMIAGVELMKKKQHGSRILREVHESARALYRSGAIDKAAMDEFDALATGFADQLANMPNVGEDEDLAREQTDRRSSGADE